MGKGKRDPKSWTEEEYERERQRQDKRLEQVKREKEIYNQRLEIREMKREMRWGPSTTSTKKYMRFIFTNLSIVEAFSMAAMWYLDDLSPLSTLITAVIGESITFIVYCAKSCKENQSEAEISLARDKLEMGITEEDTEPDRKDAMG